MSSTKLAGAAVFAVCLVLSQNSFAKETEHPRREEVNHRIRNEERRIEKGLKDGTITPAQAKKLRGELAGVKSEEKAEVQANGGSLTKYEQKQLNQELNQDSRQIKRDESSKDKKSRQGEVNARIENQEKRIDQGLKDHQLTEKEAQQLRGEEAGIKAQERAEVKADGGHLTKVEQKQLNRELNEDSSQIHKERVAGQ